MSSSSPFIASTLFLYFVAVVITPTIASPPSSSPMPVTMTTTVTPLPHSSPGAPLSSDSGLGRSFRAFYCPQNTDICTVIFTNLDSTINYTLIAVPTTFDTQQALGPVLISFKPYVGPIDPQQLLPYRKPSYLWTFWLNNVSYGSYTLYISKESAKTMTPVGVLINGGFKMIDLIPLAGGHTDAACNRQLETMTALLIATSIAIAVIGLPLFIVLRIRRQRRRKRSVDRIDAEEAAAIALLGVTSVRNRRVLSDSPMSGESDLVTLYPLDPLQDLQRDGENILHFTHSQLAVFDAPPPSVAAQSDSTLPSSLAASPRYSSNYI